MSAVKSPPSFKVVWLQKLTRESKLSPPCIAVLTTLSTYASADGSSAYPGEERLANNLGLTKETVRRWLKHGREAGWVLRVKLGDRNGNADEYRLTCPAVAMTGEKAPVIGTEMTGESAARSPESSSSMTGENFAPTSPGTRVRPGHTKPTVEIYRAAAEVLKVQSLSRADVTRLLSESGQSRNPFAVAKVLAALAAPGEYNSVSPRDIAEALHDPQVVAEL